MKQIITLSAFLLIFCAASGQVPNIQWQKTFGGSSNDEIYSAQQTADGGYIMLGTSQSNDGEVTGHHGTATNYDYWIVKTDDTGAIQWQKSLGGSMDDLGYAVRQTADGGYILMGGSESADGDLSGCSITEYDYWIIKLYSSGAIQWSTCLGGSSYNVGWSVQQTADMSYIAVGVSYSNDLQVTGNHGGADYWVVKVSSSGSLVWEKSLGGSGSDQGKCIQQTADGGYIVAGSSMSNDSQVTGNHGGVDYWVVKLNDTGAIQWQKSLGGSGEDDGKFVRQTFDGGYIVAGGSNSTDSQVTGNHGGFDFWIVKLDSAGSVQWQRSCGGTGDEWAYSVEQTLDSGYIISGGSSSADGDVTGNHGSNDYWVLKLSKSGFKQWEKSLGGTGDDQAYAIQQTTDSGFIVGGGSSSINGDITGNRGGYDYWLVKLSPCTLLSPSIVAAGAVLSTTVSYYTYQWIKNDTIIAGATNSTFTVTGNGTYLVHVTDTNGCAATALVPAFVNGVQYLSNAHTITLTPNPTSGDVIIQGAGLVKIGVYNMLGQLLKEFDKADHFSIKDLPGGLYFIKLYYITGFVDCLSLASLRSR